MPHEVLAVRVGLPPLSQSKSYFVVLTKHHFEREACGVDPKFHQPGGMHVPRDIDGGLSFPNVAGVQNDNVRIDRFCDEFVLFGPFNGRSCESNRFGCGCTGFQTRGMCRYLEQFFGILIRKE